MHSARNYLTVPGPPCSKLTVFELSQFAKVVVGQIKNYFLIWNQFIRKSGSFRYVFAGCPRAGNDGVVVVVDTRWVNDIYSQLHQDVVDVPVVFIRSQ